MRRLAPGFDPQPPVPFAVGCLDRVHWMGLDHTGTRLRFQPRSARRVRGRCWLVRSAWTAATSPWARALHLCQYLAIHLQRSGPSSDRGSGLGRVARIPRSVLLQLACHLSVAMCFARIGHHTPAKGCPMSFLSRHGGPICPWATRIRPGPPPSVVPESPSVSLGLGPERYEDQCLHPLFQHTHHRPPGRCGLDPRSSGA